MKLSCGPTHQDKHEAKKQWHTKFLWWPQRISGRDCRWLETVWRKGTFHTWMYDSEWRWEYMAVV